MNERTNERRYNFYHYYITFEGILLFGISDLTGFSRKIIPPHLVSLIKVDGLFAPYIVINFDIVNSESLVQRYIYLKPSFEHNQFS